MQKPEDREALAKAVKLRQEASELLRESLNEHNPKTQRTRLRTKAIELRGMASHIEKTVGQRSLARANRQRE